MQMLIVATKAQEFGLKRYIEVSTAFVYKSQAKTPASENADLQPWTLQAKFKLEAEEAIRNLPNLNVVFVRPATVPTQCSSSFKSALACAPGTYNVSTCVCRCTGPPISWA